MSTDPCPVNSPPKPPRFLWAQKSDYARLRREYESFRVDLYLLASSPDRKQHEWYKAAECQLEKVRRYLEEGKSVEDGWLSLHAARRHYVLGLGPDELNNQAIILRKEAEKITSTWRHDAVIALLPEQKAEACQDRNIKADGIIQAMALRDEFYENQYAKIWLVGTQLEILLITCAAGLILFLPLVFSLSGPQPEPIHPWGFAMVAAVLSFGMLGSTFSAAGSLIGADPGKRIPERVANKFVTLARSVFGACAGLAGYALYESKALNIHLGTNDLPGSALAAAVICGFAGEKFIAQLLGSLGSGKT